MINIMGRTEHDQWEYDMQWRTTCCRAPGHTEQLYTHHWRCMKCDVELTRTDQWYQMEPGDWDDWTDVLRIMRL